VRQLASSQVRRSRCDTGFEKLQLRSPPSSTRKSLGGLETNLDSRALKADGTAFDGLYAAGEAAGFGGGGVHGYRSLEGTFLGGCVFSGRAAWRAAVRDTG
jgi:uncharacterized protein